MRILKWFVVAFNLMPSFGRIVCNEYVFFVRILVLLCFLLSYSWLCFFLHSFSLNHNSIKLLLFTWNFSALFSLLNKHTKLFMLNKLQICVYAPISFCVERMIRVFFCNILFFYYVPQTKFQFKWNGCCDPKKNFQW